MKIVVSVHELSTETQAVIDNMQRSKAPVLVGDPNKPMAVLLSLDEYNRLLRESQRPTPAAPAPDAAQPVAESRPADAAAGEAASARPGDIAQRTAAAIQADRSGPAPAAPATPRPAPPKPESTPAARRLPSFRTPRLTRPLPKPPGPLQPPRPRMQLNPSAIPGGWQTIALIAGMLVLGVIGFALIVSAFSG